MRTVLQKLLHPGMSAMIRERGYSQVSGSVVRAGDAKNLRTASALQEAYGWPSGGSGHVDVVRFEVPLCATLTVPAAGGAAVAVVPARVPATRWR